MSVLPKLIYKCDAIPTRLPNGFILKWIKMELRSQEIMKRNTGQIKVFLRNIKRCV